MSWQGPGRASLALMNPGPSTETHRIPGVTLETHTGTPVTGSESDSQRGRSSGVGLLQGRPEPPAGGQRRSGFPVTAGRYWEARSPLWRRRGRAPTAAGRGVRAAGAPRADGVCRAVAVLTPSVLSGRFQVQTRAWVQTSLPPSRGGPAPSVPTGRPAQHCPAVQWVFLNLRVCQMRRGPQAAGWGPILALELPRCLVVACVAFQSLIFPPLGCGNNSQSHSSQRAQEISIWKVD